ncbi:MAG: hypothetical protein WBD33_04265 [Xanthobacteraceae bacterium]
MYFAQQTLKSLNHGRFMFDKDFFRKVLRISAAACFIITAVIVALRLGSVGRSCPALVAGAPTSGFLAVALGWQAVFWRRTHDQIVAVKARLDDMGLQNPLMEMLNYNVLLMITLAMFVGISALPLFLFFLRCA